MSAGPLDTSAASAAARVAEDAPAWGRRVWAFLAALFVLRTAVLAALPLELCPDEAYYWDWSRQLDWGYYSKPPMIAWIIGLATRVGGDHEFAIRFPALLLGTIGLWPVYALGKRMFGPRAGAWTVLAAAATPGLTAMSLLMTIDAPFLCAWAVAVYCVWRLLEGERPSWLWLAPAILATGCGLLSKQTMLAVFPLTLAWLAGSARDRAKLRSPVVWLWIVGSLLFLAPVVWWNWRHDWVTVQHTREHFQAQTVSVAGRLLVALEFWASQLGVVSPLTGGLALIVAGAALRRYVVVDRRVQFLACFSALPLVGVAGLSLVQRVQPNWPAAFHLTAIVLVAAWGTGAVSVAGVPERWRRWFPTGVAVGALLVVGVYVVPFAVPASNLAGGPLDATARLRGWRDLGRAVGWYAATRAQPEQLLMIAATGRGPVSALAFYLPGRPRVYRWNPAGVVDSQHEIWGGPVGAEGRDAVIVTTAGYPIPEPLAAAFADVEPLGEATATLGPTRRQALAVWRGCGFRGWPVAARSNAAAPHGTPPTKVAAATATTVAGGRSPPASARR